MRTLGTTPAPSAPSSPGSRAEAAARGAPVALGPVRELLRGLDGPQRRAVTHGDGPLLVVAGPGTGKTEVITRRIAWLIATRRALPSQILALTFTERAADEMQARVDALVPYGRADAAIHTFHAFGDRLTREHGFTLGLSDSPRLLGRAEGLALLREHLFELGLDRYRPLADPTRFLGALLDHFARAKEEGVTSDAYRDFAAELRAGALAVRDGATEDGLRELAEALLDDARGHAEVAAAYGRYQELLRERSLVDFGDLVLSAVAVLRDRPAERAEVRARYRYLLVDEMQDANPLQVELVGWLAGPDGNVTFVGDDDQAIYGFRGAAVETMLALREAYPRLRRIVLRRNHRSRAPILEAARRLIRHNDPDRLEVREGLDKTLRPTRRTRHDAAVRGLAFATSAEEADYVAAEIAGRIAVGERPGRFAILVRTNADARPVLASLRASGIPVRFSGAAGLLAHPEVRDVLSLLRAIADPDEPIDCYAALASEAYGLGGADMTSLLSYARGRGIPPWGACLELVAGQGPSVSPSGRSLVERFVQEVRASMELAHKQPAGQVLYAHLRASGWLGRLIGRARDGDDEPLRRLARLFETIHGLSEVLSDARLVVLAPQLRALLETAEEPERDDPGQPDDVVSVLTVHQAKGLEFPVVYLLGLGDGRFPLRARPARLPFPDALRRSAPDYAGASAMAEERRLMFVAMTRARDELTLSHSYVAAGGGRRRRPSPFIAEALDLPVPLPQAEDVARTLDRLGIAAGPPDCGVPATGSRVARAGLNLSFSQLDDFLACPLRYRLRHELRVPTPPHHALVVGSALHQAVAAWYRSVARGRPIDLAVLLWTLEEAWRSEGFLSREHEEARYAAAHRSLTDFHARESASTPRTVLAVERPFSMRLGRDVVRGRYDLVTREPEGVVITDHKSSDVRDPRRARERARASLQLGIYALAWEAEMGEAPAGVALHFIDGGLVGRVAPDEARAERVRRQVEDAAEGIRARSFEPRPGPLACGYCPFRQVCPASASGALVSLS